jgi:DNA-binding LacI/PurR family transcriptional regulator
MIQEKYTAVSEEILQRIQDGQYGDKLPGVHRLAKELGVNHLTVSKAVKRLAADGHVSIAGTKGTFVNREGARRPQTHTICVAGAYSPEESQTARDVNDAAQERGYRTIRLGAAQKELLSDRRFISSLAVDGFIFEEAVLDNAIAHALQAEGIPFVSVNSMPVETGASWIAHDSDKAHEQLLNTLYSLNHRRIAYLGMRNVSDYHQQKYYNCYRKFMKRKRIFDETLFACNCQVRETASSYDRTERKAALVPKIHELFNRPEPPTAIYTFLTEECDILLEELRSMDLSVPGDVSVITDCTDDEYDESDPFQSVFVKHTRERAIGALHNLWTLIDQHGGPYEPIRIQLDMTLVLKESVGSISLKKRARKLASSLA